jgi:hypothetical protein
VFEQVTLATGSNGASQYYPTGHRFSEISPPTSMTHLFPKFGLADGSWHEYFAHCRIPSVVERQRSICHIYYFNKVNSSANKINGGGVCACTRRAVNHDVLHQFLCGG